MIGTTVSRLALLLAAIAALAVPVAATAAPSPTRVSIAQNATFISSQQVNVELTVDCTPGYSFGGQVELVQPSVWYGHLSAWGYVGGLCSTQHQKIAVPIFGYYDGGWQLGDAVVSVNIQSAGSATATREIHIVMP